jgi:hypothetical protein
MSDGPMSEIKPGWRVFAGDGHQLGQVDAVFADYLLVRSGGLLPVDLYVPADAVIAAGNARVLVSAAGADAYERWHRPLKRAPHG